MTDTVKIAISKILPPENNMRYPLSNMSAEFNFMLRQIMEDDLYRRDKPIKITITQDTGVEK